MVIGRRMKPRLLQVPFRIKAGVHLLPRSCKPPPLTGSMFPRPGPDRPGYGSSYGQMELRPLLDSYDHLSTATRTRVETIIRGMVCTEPAAEQGDPPAPLCGREETAPLCSFSRRRHGWEEVELRSSLRSRPERLQLMAEVFKSELSRAVSRSVDAIFRSMPLLQAASEEEGGAAPQEEEEWSFSCCGAPQVQTEALALVVERSAAPRGPKPPPLLCHDPTPEEEEEQEEERPGRSAWSSKVNSRCGRSPEQGAEPRLLHPPGVKMEPEGVVRRNLHASFRGADSPVGLQQGLTGNHLRKAKLLFFYTRYPSAPLLRACFHDVQFTRCVTSQLIKWFSNFREFYYIQVEKWARAALQDVRDLTVGRESELFRALNAHYNKANDFRVPDCFLEVAEVTLREFYAAISLGKDRDPSWKKAIYKVICKLDSEVPAEFRGHL